MSSMDPLITLKTLTGESDDILLSSLLSLAESKILEYTNRTIMLDEFIPKQVEIALAMYERRGMSAESSHNEGGISNSFIDYDKMLSPLSSKRLARVGGVAHEKKQDEDVSNVSESV